MEILTNIAFNSITKQFGVIAYWDLENTKAKVMGMGVWPNEDYIRLTKNQYNRLDEYTREIDINEGWHCPTKKLIDFVFK